ncbi:WD40/YVTN repeat-like-containing domain protein [Metarhizium guizhouense ARSEF 977]|uniref:Mitochondrial division protein 1 n=1 Tax=Metarhizium guizhouense (strain ARSEF 977) TaxID=1276136 RepID=A0A0B4G778_METGA|nr:WD40/YVTN repeat-like-containing domain protein [Metarhizium guizhouense ARSEF 977]
MDAKRFAVDYGFIIERFPLQIYGAALTFWPTSSEVNERLGAERYSDIPILRDARIGWNPCLYTLRGHGGSVNAVAFSSSQKILASASSDRTVRLWDDATKAHKRTLQGHSGYVLDVAFSPDGNTLASASSDCAIRIWNVDKGSHLRTLEGHSNWVNSVVFLTNTILASASSDGTINVWDIERGISMVIFKSHSGSVNALASSRNGQLLASGSSDRTVRLWNTAEETSIKTSLEHNGSVTAVSFSPEGRFLASASIDRTVRLWDADTGSQIRVLEGHDSVVNSVTFRNSYTLATASADRTLRLWNTANHSVQKLGGRGGWLNSTAFSPDGRMIASGSSDWRVRLWSTDTCVPLTTLEGHRNWVRAVAFSTDGKLLASASTDGMLWLWDVEKRNNEASINEDWASNMLRERCCDVNKSSHNQDWVRALAFSPDGKVLASALADGTVSLLDLNKVNSIRSHDCLAVAFSLDGTVLETIRLFKTLPESLDEPTRNPSRTPPQYDKDDEDSVWKYIQASISTFIYSRKAQTGMDMETYIGIYNAVYIICGIRRGGVNFAGRAYIYAHLQNYLKRHLEQVIDESKAHSGEGLLTFYTEEWSRYSKAAKCMNNLLRLLNSDFVEYEIKQGTKGIYDVFTLHLVEWRIVVIGSISEKVVNVVLKSIEAGRNGQIIENGLIKQTVESFASLSIDLDGPSLPTLGTYRHYFETRFLETTMMYYRADSKQFLAEYGVIEYMRRAEIRLDEEDELARACLHPVTEDALRQTCIQVLIVEHSEVLRSNFLSLLDAGREEDMARTVNLLARMPDGLAPLFSKFEDHLRKAGFAAVIEAVTAAEKLESKIYVGPVSAQYHDLVRWALSGHDRRTR